DGRRIVAYENVEGFEERKWRLVNWQKFKDEMRRAQMAAASRRYRQGKKLESPSSSVINASSDRHPPSPSPSPSPKRIQPPFIPPTGDEVRKEFETQGVNGEHWRDFFDWWQELNWKGVKDWRRRAGMWIRKRRQEGRYEGTISGKSKKR